VIGKDGLDMSDHRSQLLVRRVMQRSDLILGMAREHVREAVALDPPAWPRSFTLKEFVRRGEAVGPRPKGQLLRAWLDDVGAGRRHENLLGSSPVDDVEDPMNAGEVLCRATGKELLDLVVRVLSLIAPET
jgi:protein-tyrosine phosphatase